MGLFRAIIIILFVGIFFYLSHQLLRFTGLSLGPTLGVLIFLAALFGVILAMPLYFMTESRLRHQPWHDSFFSAAHFALAYINFLGTLVILRDIVAFVASFSPADSVPAWMTSEALYGSMALGILLLAPLFFILVGTIVVRVGPRLKTVKVSFPDLPPALEGLRILHITDLHIGTSLPMKFVEKLVAASQKVQADLVVYTGDILDGSSIRHLAEIEMLKKIQAPLGSYYVPGNHEYYWQVEQALAAFRAIGLNVLVNKVMDITRNGATLQIGGIPDPAAMGFSLEGPNFKELQKELKPNSFKLLLSHQPSLAPFAADAGFDLQLSGHTHGGQFFPWNFLIGFFQKYPKGLYQVQKLKLYVNQGTGYWGPSLRMGTYCELTEIVLGKKS